MNLVFAADSPWNWEAEKNYKRMVEENPGLVRAARRGDNVVANTGVGVHRDSKFDQADPEHVEKEYRV